MIRGVYKGSANSIVLQPGQKYYLFPHGNTHYYVSRFPNEGAHTGCFSKELFDVIEDEEEKEEEALLDEEKCYTADLVRKRSGSYPTVVFKTYYIKPHKTHAYFWHDPEMKKFGGCFPLEWYDNFAEFEPIVTEETIEEVEESEVIIEEPKESPKEPEPIEDSVQLSLFDF